MIKTIPLTELRPQLPQVVEKARKYLDRFIITRHGKPEAVLLSEEDYESLLETLESLSDTKLIKELNVSIKELNEGKGIDWEKAKEKLDRV